MNLPLSFQPVNNDSGPPEKNTVIPAHAMADRLMQMQAVYYKATDFACLEQTLPGSQCPVFSYHIYMRTQRKLFAMSAHSRVTLLFMIKGNIECYLYGFGRILLKEGFIYCMYMPGQSHSKMLLTRNDFQIDQLDIPQSLMDEWSKEDARIGKVCSRFKNEAAHGIAALELPISSYARQTLKKMKTVAYTTEGRINMFLYARATDLLLDMAEQSDKPAREDANRCCTYDKKEVVYRAKEMIDSHSGTPLPISAIAKATHIREAELQKYFKETLLCTVGQYQKIQRIEKAKQLLLSHKHWAIHKICREVGYEDESSLSREFKKMEKLTPQQFRKLHKK